MTNFQLSFKESTFFKSFSEFRYGYMTIRNSGTIVVDIIQQKKPKNGERGEIKDFLWVLF